MKTCNRCLKQKSKQEFSVAKTCKDGYRNYCKECQSLKKKEWYEQNKDYVLTKTTEWHKQNPEKVRQTKKRWAEQNSEYASQYKIKYRQEHRDRINAHTALRRKRVQQNTPIWANKYAILQFYLNCPKGFHVDHVLPLKGKTVSGLHTIENLQYLPASENMAKGNKEVFECLI